MSTLDLVTAIMNKDATAIESEFNNAMAEKISSKIEDMRTNISQSMFNSTEQEAVVEEEFELEEAKKKWKKMCEEELLDLSEEDLAEAKKKWKKMCEGLTQEEVEQIDEKNWIAGAIKKPGAETAAAKRAGMSTHEYMEKHKHDSGKSGARARLGLTLSKLAKK